MYEFACNRWFIDDPDLDIEVELVENTARSMQFKTLSFIFLNLF